jgi:predicted DNA-binding protein (UPF0251 family)
MTPCAKKVRFCRQFDGNTYFKPSGIALGELQINDLLLDELEAMYLCDFESLDQKTAADKMQISTSTLQRLLYLGRKKAIDALYNSKALKISKHDAIKEYVVSNDCDVSTNCRKGRGMCNSRHSIPDELTSNNS